MTEKLIWGFSLVGMGVALVILEFIVPSGGLIAITAALVAIAGVVAFWMEDPIWGIVSGGGVLAFGIAAIFFFFKIFPYTPMGRGLILGAETGEDDHEAADALRAQQSEREAREALIGVEGVALANLHPIGAVEIEGTRIEALAEGGWIEQGTRVRVVSVEGNQVKVRAIRG